LLREQWDVVHCWEEPYVIAAAQVARGIEKTARFVPATFQNIDKTYPWPVRALERHVMARADAWVAFGQTAYDTQRGRAGYASKPARVLSPGVDITSFHPDLVERQKARQRMGLAEHDVLVGFVGRLVEEKGVDTLVRAFERSARQWHLLFVGGGPLASRIRLLQRQHPARVRLIEDATHDDVPSYLRAMDLMCAPSRTTTKWREQFGRMLIEAMASGVPIIASDSGEIPHVIQDAGLLVAEDDIPKWTASIERLVGDPAMRGGLASRGLARARAEFAWPIVARQHLDFFDEVLAK
jgi:glycosyltransferase involved in cell wall biosynthesis